MLLNWQAVLLPCRAPRRRVWRAVHPAAGLHARSVSRNSPLSTDRFHAQLLFEELRKRPSETCELSYQHPRMRHALANTLLWSLLGFPAALA